MKQILVGLFTLILTMVHAQSYQKETLDIDREIQGDLYWGNTTNNTVVLLIAGSGPTDRNGNQLPTIFCNSLKLLAESLAKNGHNVFTFDKRIIAQLKNKTTEEGVVFENQVNDVVLIINTLRNQFSNIIIAGHSEGALIGLLAAQQQNIKAFVSLSGAGQNIDKIITKQLSAQAPFLQKKVEDIFTQLKTGQEVKDIIPMLKNIFNPVNQPYLMSWIKYDPAAEIAKLKIPILIVNGTKDIQVDEEEAQLLHQGNPKSQLQLIEGMNHIFKKIERDQDNIKSYNQVHLPLHPDLTVVLTQFLDQLN